MNMDMIMIAVNGAIGVWWLWVLIGIAVVGLFRKNKSTNNHHGASLVGNTHQDFMAQTSGAPTSNGCISPVYLSNDNSNHF